MGVANSPVLRQGHLRLVHSSLLLRGGARTPLLPLELGPRGTLLRLLTKLADAHDSAHLRRVLHAFCTITMLISRYHHIAALSTDQYCHGRRILEVRRFLALDASYSIVTATFDTGRATTGRTRPCPRLLLVYALAALSYPRPGKVSDPSFPDAAQS